MKTFIFTSSQISPSIELRQTSEGRHGRFCTEQEGELPFWICEPVSEWSSFDRSIASRNGSAHYPITMRCRQFGSILEEFGIPYYLKIDIEANDFLCVQEPRSVT
jgi:hypothetical protein